MTSRDQGTHWKRPVLGIRVSLWQLALTKTFRAVLARDRGEGGGTRATEAAKSCGRAEREHQRSWPRSLITLSLLRPTSKRQSRLHSGKDNSKRTPSVLPLRKSPSTYRQKSRPRTLEQSLPTAMPRRWMSNLSTSCCSSRGPRSLTPTRTKTS